MLDKIDFKQSISWEKNQYTLETYIPSFTLENVCILCFRLGSPDLDLKFPIERKIWKRILSRISEIEAFLTGISNLCDPRQNPFSDFEFDWKSEDPGFMI